MFETFFFFFFLYYFASRLSKFFDIPESSTRTFTHWHTLTKRMKKIQITCGAHGTSASGSRGKKRKNSPFSSSYISLCWKAQRSSSQSSSYLGLRLCVWERESENRRGKKRRASADRKKRSRHLGAQLYTLLLLYFFPLPPTLDATLI